MQKGIQPRPVTAQTPNAHPLNGKNGQNQFWLSLPLNEEKRCRRADQTHYVYPPDTFVVLLTVRCWHTGHWTGTGESLKGTL